LVHAGLPIVFGDNHFEGNRFHPSLMRGCFVAGSKPLSIARPSIDFPSRSSGSATGAQAGV
jgi:hypothetical protein